MNEKKIPCIVLKYLHQKKKQIIKSNEYMNNVNFDYEWKRTKKIFLNEFWFSSLFDQQKIQRFHTTIYTYRTGIDFVQPPKTSALSLFLFLI